MNAFNLYAYCSNNPVTGYDPKGTWNWGTVLDVAIGVGSVVVGTAVGPLIAPLGAVAGINGTIAAGVLGSAATTGVINNGANAIYYNNISEGESSLSSNSYNDGYINRWERLDYTKHQLKESGVEYDKYNSTARNYYSEYNYHMYAWFLLGWAHNQNIYRFSKFAERAKDAYVEVGSIDLNPEVLIPTIIIGLLGF